MRRSIGVVAISIMAVLALVSPAGANHNTPVTVLAQSTYAGTCGSEPGPNTETPVAFQNALTANRNTAPANMKIPTDLGNGLAAGACTHGNDAIWLASTNRYTATCNATTKTTCVGLHYPSVGPPVMPGRFLNYARHSATPDPKNACAFASSGSPNSGTCSVLTVGYVLPVVTPNGISEGGYCGTSRGFGWSMSASNATMTTNQGFSVVEWIPTSAGSLLPISGVTTGPDWTANSHYSGVGGTAGTASMTINGSKNIFGLVSARSYINGVDNETTSPGSCGNPTNTGAVQFFNQSVAVSLGN